MAIMAVMYPIMVYKQHQGQLRTRECVDAVDHLRAIDEGWLSAPPSETAPTRQHCLDRLEDFCGAFRAGTTGVRLPEEIAHAQREAALLLRTSDAPHARTVLAQLERLTRGPFRPHSPLHGEYAMFVSTLREVSLAGMSLEELLFMEQHLLLLIQGYTAHTLEVPPAIGKRQKEVTRKITEALEAEIEALEREAQELEDKAKKREAAREKAAKLRATLEKS